ncbi:MAG TPA: bifunctional [glutamate--ammonia ligase]-adenylyl-L-tyrosine phosphorylase/[glutamate--ammonia-ligase] adenylyltransferase [Burkholderiaceae bacterium]|nr:bifunctional [glutamate--ammonia ligase]-adenylyl-L-tyrosine phosphorylase/[glutamate--ammonia-ligase] adenylyltransferase [Burkholderiaceae bacterium]
MHWPKAGTGKRMVRDVVADGAAPDLESACTRAYSASTYLRRALLAEGFAPPAAEEEPSATAGLRWLVGMAQKPWSAPQIAEQYERNLAQVRRGAASASNVSPSAHRGAMPEAEVAAALRRTRRQLLCALMVRDAARLAPLEEVTGAMTALAELAVCTLLAVIAPQLAAVHGTPVDAAGTPQDLLVLAMGKGGAAELNVSSDLDLIFVYGDVHTCRPPGDAPAPGALPSERAHGAGVSGQEFFDRLGRRLVAALSQHEADGFIFRVDLRLRPHGDSGPLAVSIAMLEEYLVREGREWERFAWAKARVVSQPVLAPAQDFARVVATLESVVQPFVYRKYFDFGAIGAIRELHHRIGAEARRRSRGRHEHIRDVKLGRGGIREIEFLAQSFCIMRGGRDHRLRARSTQATLQTLGQIGLLDAAHAERLIQDYRFLRRLEHAVQYRDDAQTHRIPADAEGRDAVAKLLHLDDGQQVLQRYERVSQDVARSFDNMFPRDTRLPLRVETSEVPAPSAARLAQFGFADAAASAERLQRFFASPRLAAMSAGARGTIERLALRALPRIGGIARETQPQGGAGPDEILLRWIRLVEVIGRRSTYFSLLEEFPVAHERVLRVLATGGWATEYLLTHPIVLDELIDPRAPDFSGGLPVDATDVPPGAMDAFWVPWATQIDRQLHAAAGDVERQMNILRDAHHAQVFRLLLADLAGNLRLERLADHLSALADAVLRLALGAAWRSMSAGAPGNGAQAPPPRLAIIAYGKLGGRELGYASDLDLTFVYEPGAGKDAAERDAQLYGQLVRRLIAWLTTATSSGKLFEIDLRLRPDGNAGLLVIPIEAFERYQCNTDGHGAWVWEHQALTRARVCAGDAALAQRIEQLRERVLRQVREPANLAAEVVDMRRRMLEGHENRSGEFDLKHDRGGMVDIEFIVQYLVLAHAHQYAALVANRGNIGLLTIAAQLALIEPDTAQACAHAYRRYRRMQHTLRLNGAERARVDRTLVHEQIEAVLGLWRRVFGTDQPLPAAPSASAPRGLGGSHRSAQNFPSGG